MQKKFFPGLIAAGLLSLSGSGWTGSPSPAREKDGQVNSRSIIDRIFSYSAAVGIPLTDPLSEVVESIARDYGLSPRLVKSIIQVESKGDPRALSPKGAMGLMQLMPETARRYFLSDPFDPVENILAGVRYLRNLMLEFPGDLSLALAAYNAGSGRVKQYGGLPPYRETREFVRKVSEQYHSREELPQFFGPSFMTKKNAAVRKVPGEIYLQAAPKKSDDRVKKQR